MIPASSVPELGDAVVVRDWLVLAVPAAQPEPERPRRLRLSARPGMGSSIEFVLFGQDFIKFGRICN